MTRTRRRSWSGRREAAVAAMAAVGAFGVLVGGALLWDTTHPPAAVRNTATPTLTESSTHTMPPAAAATLLRAAAAALRATSTAHVVGAVGGGLSPVRVDLSVTAHGDAMGGLVVAGVPVDVIRTGGHTYVRSKQLVRTIAGGTVASYVGDRWLALDARQLGAAGIDRALDRATSLDGIASLVGASAGLAQGGVPTTVAGQRVVEVVSGATVIDVAADGTPYPLRVSVGEGTTLDLDSFGSPVVVTVPSGVVDLGQLPGIG